MLNRTFESCASAHDADFFPHPRLHLAHQLFESGVDGSVRISYARLAPGLGWTMAKFVAHFPAGPGTKDQTLEQGIAGQAIRTMHTAFQDCAGKRPRRAALPKARIAGHSSDKEP